MNNILEVHNISKQYRLGTVGTGTLSHDLNRWWHKVRGKEDPYLKVGATNDRTKKDDNEYVWALKDISFNVQQGEVLGIIGKNGAGKSTLLKILSKVTGPTTGSIKAYGRIASLLEVGTGFHPELTGRENIFLNGAILGMTKAEIRSKFEEIVDFSGVEKYIDTPVKRYSSGMYVRLAFAVAAHLEPEILIVDEVLAVGDAEFQKKALGKMKDVSQGQGRTVLFVSHNMGAVRNLCTRCIMLGNGSMSMNGTTEEVINNYMNSSSKISSYIIDNNPFKNYSITLFRPVKGELKDVFSFSHNEKIFFELELEINNPQQNVDVVLLAMDLYLNKIFSSITPISITSKGKVKKIIEVPANFLTPGYVNFTVSVYIANKRVIDSLPHPLKIEIIDKGSNFVILNSTDYGSVFANCIWTETIEQ
ncbi:MAG: ABC transporter ATP-binding protein [Bacteroidales bacterium]|nr:ABC transporter ATP-binding protein [Bacteroidales bacterium]